MTTSFWKTSQHFYLQSFVVYYFKELKYLRKSKSKIVIVKLEDSALIFKHVNIILTLKIH